MNKLDSAGYSLGPVSDGGMDPRDRPGDCVCSSGRLPDGMTIDCAAGSLLCLRRYDSVTIEWGNNPGKTTLRSSNE